MTDILAATRYAPAWFGIVIVAGFLILVIAMVATAVKHRQ